MEQLKGLGLRCDKVWGPEAKGTEKKHTHTHTNPDMDGTEAKTGTRGKTKDRRENTKQQKKLNVQCQVVKPALTQKVTLISTESLD